MPTLDSRIDDVVVGDDLTIRRTIGFALTGFPTGTTINKAWLTVKAAIGDADPGLFQKAVTTSDVVGTGQIENDGTGDVDMVVRFDLLPANTTAIGPTKLREFDIQVKTAGGQVYTPERGQISGIDEVTIVAV